jgi:type I restriction enzyme S subunit
MPKDPTEQTKIAEILSTVDRAIEQTEALTAKQQRLKTGLMQDLLTRGIDEHGNLRSEQTHPFKDSPLGRIPVEWEVKSLGSLAEFLNGNSFSSRDWKEHGLPIIRIQNLNSATEFNYYQGTINERWLIRTGDLLFAWAGQRNSSFGPRIWKGPQAVLNQHIFKVVPNTSRVSKEFIFTLLSFNLSRIEDEAHGFKDSFLHVPKGDLVQIPVSVPTTDEQSRIVEQSQSSRLVFEGLLASLSKLRALRIALMQDLLTGRKRVTELLNA